MFTPDFWRIRRFSAPVLELIRLQREMNRLFSNAGSRQEQEFPAINIWEDKDSVFVTAEIPGINPEKFDVAVVGDMLSLAGNVQEETLKKGEIYSRQERGLGNFQRSIRLPFQVDSPKVEAKYEKGILNIILPRLKEDLPKKIKITG
jgi:HSP20 family protein